MNHQARTVGWLCGFMALLAIPWIARTHLPAQETPQGMERERLLATIRDPELRERDPDRLIQAIQRLGIMKETAAIDDLIPLLTFRRLYPEDKDPSLGRNVEGFRTSARRFPAIEALVLIGRPALPPLTRVIGTSAPDSLESRCALEAVRLVFLDIYGGDTQNPEKPGERVWSEAVKYLVQAASEASSPEAGERLQLGAEKLKHREDYRRPY